MKAPQKNTEKRKPKELILATLTDAGLLRPLYYFLVASAAISGTVGLSAATLTPSQEEQRAKIKVVLTPPKEKDHSEIVVSQETPPSPESTSMETNTMPEPSATTVSETEQTSLPVFINRLETAARDGNGLYELLKEAKAQLSPTELRNLIVRLVEITDENYPLPTQGMSEEQVDEY